MRPVGHLVVATIAVITLASVARAQEPAAPPDIPKAEDRAKQLTDKMTETLSLDAAQAAQVAEINLDTAKKVDEVRARGSADRRSVLGDLRTLQRERDERLKPLLTAEQWTIYEQKKEELAENVMSRRRSQARTPSEPQ